MLNRLSRRCFCSGGAAPRQWLFVGLGNPGDKYRGTRHNVGFEMIDAFAESQGIQMNSVHCKAVLLVKPVFLAKPQTYMNLSGESTGPLAAYYKLPLNRVLVAIPLINLYCAYSYLFSNCYFFCVFMMDMNLPCGVLHLHDRGGHGSRNGLKSVIYHFRGNREFARLRIGVGRPPGQRDPKAFLFQRFKATAQER
ncbi:hypothetical protein UlMin_033423, partial [Ulmus minor]